MIRHDPSDLGSRLYSAVSTRSVNTEPSSFTDALAYFGRLAGGSVRAMATLMGVPRRTLRDWMAGATPSAARRKAVADSARLSARRERLRPGRENRLRASDSSDVTIVAVYNYDGGDARTVRIGDYLDPDTINQVVDAYLDGASPDELRTGFASNIQDPTGFYERTFALPASDEHGWTVTRVNL